MNISTRRFAPLLFGAALVAQPAARADILEQILVKVNGDIITKTDLEQRQVAVLRQRNLAASDPNSEELKKALVEITPQIIVDAVDELLLVQRGKELGYKLSDEQFNGIIDNIRKENKIESDDQFQAALKQEGLTTADLRKTLERQMLISRVQQSEVMEKIGITEEEAKTYYDANRAEFTTAPAVTLREIVVNVPTDGSTINVAADEEAGTKAEAIRARLVAGESFDKLAAESSDAPSKANGGLVGPLNPNELAPVFKKTVESLKVGEISEVIRAERGYHILKLESATEPKVLPLEQAREQIAEKVFGAKRRAEFEKYLKKLRAQAIIEWKNDEIRKAYEQGLSARAAATAQ